MAEFNLYARFDASVVTDADELYEPYLAEYNGVDVATTDAAESSADPDVFSPEAYLEIEGVETLAAVYTDLQSREEVRSISLSGPTADRFAVPVAHYALQQIGDPKLYEFHALDNQKTLVIAESEMELDRVTQEVPAGALG